MYFISSDLKLKKGLKWNCVVQFVQKDKRSRIWISIRIRNRIKIHCKMYFSWGKFGRFMSFLINSHSHSFIYLFDDFIYWNFFSLRNTNATSIQRRILSINNFILRFTYIYQNGIYRRIKFKIHYKIKWFVDLTALSERVYNSTLTPTIQ